MNAKHDYKNVHPWQKSVRIEEAAEILHVSAATVRNWIKSNKISNIKKQDQALWLDRDEILEIQDDIKTGRSSRLRRRRNKEAISGNNVPIEYVVSEQYCKVAETIVQMVEEVPVKISPRLVLLELALNLLNDQGSISCPPIPKKTSLSELAMQRDLPLGIHHEVLNNLYDFNTGISKDEANVLRKICELGINFIEGDDLLGLVYISLSNLGRRKTSGSYYTPTNLVDSLVKRSVKFLQGVTFPRAVDPCCGSGNFLIKLFLSLRSKLLAAGLAIEDVEQRLMQDCLFGYDIDQIAVVLAQINLGLLLQGKHHRPVKFNIECKNPLENYGTIFGDDIGSFDLVIGNPPWGYSFTRKEISSFKNNFVSAQASMESFCLFIEYGISILKQNGVLSYVLPEALLNVGIHTTVRELLLRKTKIQSIQLLGQQFSKVFAPAITLTAIRSDDVLTNDVIVNSAEKSYSIPQGRFWENEMYIFNVNATNVEDEIVKLMQSAPGVMFLKDNADFALGIVTGNNKKYVVAEKISEAEPVLKGKDIFKYNVLHGGSYLVFKPDRFQQVAPISLYRSKEKLVYRFINKNLIFAYDNQGTLSLNSANILVPNLPGHPIKYVMAVLNSRAAQFFHTASFSSVKVLRKHIESIPIPYCDQTKQEEIVSLVDRLLVTREKSIRVAIYEMIDQQIMELYGLNNAQQALIKGQNEKVKYM